MALRALSTSTETFPAHTDVRGWDVRLRGHEAPVGAVRDILVGEDDRTRYVSVRTGDRERFVLVPSGYVEADEDRRTVWVRGLARRHFDELPEYAGDPATVTETYEDRLWAVLDAPAEGAEYYDRPQYAAKWSGAGGRDAAGELARLDDLENIRVATQDHDPRSWRVVGGDGEELGVVDHLVGDTGAMKVRYLEMKVRPDLADGDRHVLIPAGHARLEPEHERVRVDALDRARVRTAPAHEGGIIRREDERRLCAYFDEGYRGGRRSAHPRFATDRLGGRRDTRH